MADVIGFWGWSGSAAIGSLGLVVAAIAVVVAIRALIESRRASALLASIDLLREYRSPEMREARKRILKLDLCDRDGTLESLTDGERQDIEAVGNYLDYLGLLVSQDLLEIDAPAMFLGGSAIGMWRRLRPIIDAERRKKTARGTYQTQFEDLIVRFEEYPIEEKIAKLKKMPRLQVR